jgi:hypothetical protein
MRPSGAKPNAVTSSSMLTEGLSSDCARAAGGWTRKKEITQRAQRGRRHRVRKWRVASGEWRACRVFRVPCSVKSVGGTSLSPSAVLPFAADQHRRVATSETRVLVSAGRPNSASRESGRPRESQAASRALRAEPARPTADFARHSPLATRHWFSSCLNFPLNGIMVWDVAR